MSRFHREFQLSSAAPASIDMREPPKSRAVTIYLNLENRRSGRPGVALESNREQVVRPVAERCRGNAMVGLSTGLTMGRLTGMHSSGWISARNSSASGTARAADGEIRHEARL
jgi:hypothetical protein